MSGKARIYLVFWLMFLVVGKGNLRAGQWSEPNLVLEWDYPFGLTTPPLDSYHIYGGLFALAICLLSSVVCSRMSPNIMNAFPTAVANTAIINIATPRPRDIIPSNRSPLGSIRLSIVK